MKILSIDHVQLAMPIGEEEKARSFFINILGFHEIPKPAELAKRGGAWFESENVQLHIGVEADFRPARKAMSVFWCARWRCADCRSVTPLRRSSLLRREC